MKQIKSILLLCISMAYAGGIKSVLSKSASSTTHADDRFKSGFAYVLSPPNHTLCDIVEEIGQQMPEKANDLTDIPKAGSVTYAQWYKVMSAVLELQQTDLTPAQKDLYEKFHDLVRFDEVLRSRMFVPQNNIQKAEEVTIQLEKDAVTSKKIPKIQSNNEVLQELYPWTDIKRPAERREISLLHPLWGILERMCLAISDPEMEAINKLCHAFRASESDFLKVLTFWIQKEHISNPLREILQSITQGNISDSITELEEGIQKYNLLSRFQRNLYPWINKIKTSRLVSAEEWAEVKKIMRGIGMVINNRREGIEPKFETAYRRIRYIFDQFMALDQTTIDLISRKKVFQLGRLRENMMFYHTLKAPLKAYSGLDKACMNEILLSLEKFFDFAGLVGQSSALWRGCDVHASIPELIDVATRILHVVEQISDIDAVYGCENKIRFNIKGMNLSKYVQYVQWFVRALRKLEKLQGKIGSLTIEHYRRIRKMMLIASAGPNKIPNVILDKASLILIKNLTEKYSLQEMGEEEVLEDSLIEMPKVVTSIFELSATANVCNEAELSEVIVETEEIVEKKHAAADPLVPVEETAIEVQITPDDAQHDEKHLDLEESSEEESAEAKHQSVAVQIPTPQAQRPKAKIYYLPMLCEVLQKLYNPSKMQARVLPDLHRNLKSIAEIIQASEFNFAIYYDQCPPEGALEEALALANSIQITCEGCHTKGIGSWEGVVTGSANFSGPWQSNYRKFDILVVSRSNYAFKQFVMHAVNVLCRSIANPNNAKQKLEYLEKLQDFMNRFIDHITNSNSSSHIRELKKFARERIDSIFSLADLKPNTLADTAAEFSKNLAVNAIPDDKTTEVEIHYLSPTGVVNSEKIQLMNTSLNDFNQTNLDAICFPHITPGATIKQSDVNYATGEDLLKVLMENMNDAEEIYFTSTSAPVKELRDLLKKKNAKIKIDVGGSYEGFDSKILNWIKSVLQIAGQHSKSVLIKLKNGKYILCITSSNFSTNGLKNNFESVVLIRTSNPKLAEQYIKFFDGIS